MKPQPETLATGLNLPTQQRTFEISTPWGPAEVSCRRVRYPSNVHSAWFIRLYRKRETFGPWSRRQLKTFLAP